MTDKSAGDAAHSSKPNLNTGNPWSEMDVVDLTESVEQGRLVHEIADFICRSEVEVAAKIEELGLAGKGRPR